MTRMISVIFFIISALYLKDACGIAPIAKVETLVGVGRAWGFSNDPPVVFTHVEGMEMDQENRIIYICDSWNNCVRKFDINTGITSTVAGICDYYANGYLDGVATSAKFDKPLDIKLASNGDLYIADAYNNCIRKVSQGQVTTAAGQCGTTAANRGYINGIGTNAMFNGARRLVFDSLGFLLISDTENNCIRKLNTITNEVSDFAGQCASNGASLNGAVSSARLWSPYGLELDKTTGDIFISDYFNQCIKRISNGIISVYSGICATGAATVDGNANSGRYNYPIAVKYDSTSGILFVSQNHCIRRVAADKTLTTWAGTCGTTAYLDGFGTASNFWAPTQLTLDSQRPSLYITDSWNYAIRNVTAVCPQNAFLDRTTFDCICLAGYTPNSQSTSCIACSIGYFKETYGFQSCSSCLIGTESLTNRTGCIPCSSGKYRSSLSQGSCQTCPTNSQCSATEFKCLPGYGYDSATGSCNPCPTGQFKNVTENTACASCPQNSEPSSGKNYCESYYCPQNAVCPQRSTIICKPGFEPNDSGSDCVSCRLGYVKPTLDNSLCLACEWEKVSNGDFTSCISCSYGMYKDLSQQKCVLCPVNSIACSGVGFTCADGYKKSPSGTDCVVNSVQQEFSLSTFVQENVFIVYGLAGIAVLSIVLYITFACCTSRSGRVKNQTITTDLMMTSTMNTASRANVESMKYRDGKSFVSDVTNTTSFNTAFGNGMTLMSNAKTTESFLSIPAFLQFEGDRDFTTDKYLTKGGGGSVYLGTARTDDTAHYGEKIIVKKIHTPKNQSETDLFYQELSIMYMLREHQNIAKLIGFSIEPYFSVLMKYYPLGSLEQWLDRRTEMRTKSTAFFFLKDICEGVATMHRNGLAHADLKPPNILLDTDASGSIFCVLIDFGITRIVRQDIIKVQAFHAVEVRAASIAFASPETLKNFRGQSRATFDPQRGDIYSIAIILFCLLVGDTQPWSMGTVSSSIISTAQFSSTISSGRTKSSIPKAK